jgi:hypothetical protein
MSTPETLEHRTSLSCGTGYQTGEAIQDRSWWLAIGTLGNAPDLR